jgi:hypothetical protein
MLDAQLIEQQLQFVTISGMYFAINAQHGSSSSQSAGDISSANQRDWSSTGKQCRGNIEQMRTREQQTSDHCWLHGGVAGAVHAV